MVNYHCSHGLCNEDSRKDTGVKFIPFPSRKQWPEKCKRWVLACGRENFKVENITRHQRICSKHYFGEQGPTPEHPDPIPTNKTEEQVTFTILLSQKVYIWHTMFSIILQHKRC
jgi:hypothetical protein